MTKDQLEKYNRWIEYAVKTVVGLCLAGLIPLFIHYAQSQTIHETQSKDIEKLQIDVKKTIVIPESIKLNAFKINQCNKSIDEVKRDFKDFKIEQNRKMDRILDLLIEIKSDN